MTYQTCYLDTTKLKIYCYIKLLLLLLLLDFYSATIHLQAVVQVRFTIEIYTAFKFGQSSFSRSFRSFMEL